MPALLEVSGIETAYGASQVLFGVSLSIGVGEVVTLIGRNGMHKYNNQDHSMMTAMLCVENIVAGRREYDLWQVNEDAEYHEAGERGASTTGLRQVPRALRPEETGAS